MVKDITGVILCGGMSSRMKTNKALLRLGDKTVIEIMADKMQSIFSKVILSSCLNEEYSFLNLPIIKDKFINKGPLAGIHSTLTNVQTEKNFVISCDLTLVPEDLIGFLIEYRSNKKIILPIADGRIQNLCGVYSKSIVVVIEKILLESEKNKNVKGSIYELIEKVKADIVEIDSLPFYNKNIFLNMNTPEDYKIIKNIYKKN